MSRYDRTNESHRLAMKQVRAIQGALPFNCEDGNRDEDAAVNLVEGKPAFACGFSYSNAFGSLLSSAANRLGSIEAAQEELANESGLDEYRDEEHLARLYPLNRAADTDLKLAYQRCGTWITSAEIRRRIISQTNTMPLYKSVDDAVPVLVAAE